MGLLKRPGVLDIGNAIDWEHPDNQGLVFSANGVADGAGSRLTDLVRGNHGTLINGPTWTPTARGDIGLRLNGTSQYVTTGLNAGGLAGYTIAAWVRSTSDTPVEQAIANTNYDGVSVSISLQIASGGGLPGLAYFNGSWKVSGVTTVIRNTSVWRRVVGVFEGGVALRYYLDGRLDAQNTSGIVATLPASANPLDIGVYRHDGSYLAGNIADFRVYHEAKNAAWVTRDYERSLRPFTEDDTLRFQPTSRSFMSSAASTNRRRRIICRGSR